MPPRRLPAAQQTISAYEQQRLERIAENDQKLATLGLDDAAAAVRKPKRERSSKPRAKAPLPAPSRGSRRLAGHVAEPLALPDDFVEPSELQMLSDGLKRASGKPRLSEAQMDKLNKFDPVSAAPLTAHEVARVARVADDLAEDRPAGGWRKNDNQWAKLRTVLRTAAQKHGLRWPKWLDDIEAALPGKWGTTPASKDQTLFGLERAALGLGLHYREWPQGVGVLLANEALEEGATPPVPRLMTLGADTEMLRREGQRLEVRFGHDRGNGWVYNHSVNKLRLYQEKLLAEQWGEEPEAPSVRELEAEQEEEEEAAAAAAAAAAPPRAAVVSFEDFVVPDGEGEEEVGAGRKKRAKPKPKRKAPKEVAEEDEEDEDAPLSKRRGKRRASE